MSVIENFAALPAKEQMEFAVALLKTINSENIFSSETKFEITNVEADDLTGGLMIEVSQTNPIEVSREASWSCSDPDDASDDPGYDAEYVENIITDAKKAFTTLSATIEGYKVSLEISDVDDTKTVEVEVGRLSQEDAGIGSYEYWGERGYDSRPYIGVEGTIVKSCDCALAFFVEPDDAIEIAPEEN